MEMYKSRGTSPLCDSDSTFCLPNCNSLVRRWSYETVRNAGKELIEAEYQITVLFFFLSPSLACECFENSINVGGQSGRLQIQVRMLIEKPSVVTCCWWVVKAVFKQRYTCSNV